MLFQVMVNFILARRTKYCILKKKVTLEESVFIISQVHSI